MSNRCLRPAGAAAFGVGAAGFFVLGTMQASSAEPVPHTHPEQRQSRSEICNKGTEKSFAEAAGVEPESESSEAWLLLCEAHGGSIAARIDGRGRGATFIATFPV